MFIRVFFTSLLATLKRVNYKLCKKSWAQSASKVQLLSSHTATVYYF